MTTGDGRAAVIFVGSKGTGDKYWYGWVHPAGAENVCVETAFVGEFAVCRLADGSVCPPEDLQGCSDHNDYRGWWSTQFSAQFILYSPDDLAQVALGEMRPDQPQPYARLTVDDHLFRNPEGVEMEMLGAGVQQRGLLGAAAYDRQNQFLYVLELFADGAQPVVHVWQVG